ncbi:MAG TPA: response regulator [Kofleriaceae bacterium]|nr:response regulator [Kofleriaceae bacterium]
MSRPRILLAEDDDDLRAELAELLAREGMDVVQATTGDESLSILARGGIDLVITDVMMPSPVGVQVAAMARTAGENVPILVITGHDERWIHEIVERICCADLLLKPFSTETLLDRIRVLLSRCASGQGAAPG